MTGSRAQLLAIEDGELYVKISRPKVPAGTLVIDAFGVFWFSVNHGTRQQRCSAFRRQLERLLRYFDRLVVGVEGTIKPGKNPMGQAPAVDHRYDGTADTRSMSMEAHSAQMLALAAMMSEEKWEGRLETVFTGGEGEVSTRMGWEGLVAQGAEIGSL